MADETVGSQPKRLSVILGDKGYQHPSKLGGYLILFNGVKQDNCSVADTEKGYIVQQVIRRNPATGKSKIYHTGRRFGKVEIKLKGSEIDG